MRKTRKEYPKRSTHNRNMVEKANSDLLQRNLAFNEMGIIDVSEAKGKG